MVFGSYQKYCESTDAQWRLIDCQLILEYTLRNVQWNLLESIIRFERLKVLYTRWIASKTEEKSFAYRNGIWSGCLRQSERNVKSKRVVDEVLQRRWEFERKFCENVLVYDKQKSHARWQSKRMVATICAWQIPERYNCHCKFAYGTQAAPV